MTVGAAIVVAALVLLLVARPGLALVLAVAVAGSITVFVRYSDDQQAKRTKEVEREKEFARTAIRSDDLLLEDIALGRTGSLDGRSFQIKGTVTNRSKFPVKSFDLEVTITDCGNASSANGESCRTIGQEHIGIWIDTPPKQTRAFETTAVTFEGMPEPWRCLDNAPLTWRHFTGPSATERDKEDYSQGFVRGRSFVHPEFGFTFTAPEQFTLTNTPDALLGAQEGGTQALRLDTVSVQSDLSLSDYLASGPVEKIEPQSIRQFTINGLQAATATASGDLWRFRVYVLRKEGVVYRVIYTARKGNEEADRSFRDSINTFRPVALAEAACPTKGRSFAWKIIRVEAAGFGY